MQKKTKIIASVFLILLIGAVIVQSQADCDLCKGLLKLYERLKSIDEKTCRDVNIAFSQKNPRGDVLDLKMEAGFSSPAKEIFFTIIRPEREGSLINLDAMHVFGNMSSAFNSSAVDISCGVSINNQFCFNVSHQTQPPKGNVQFYDDISPCLQYINSEELNKLTVQCGSRDNNAKVNFDRVEYDGTWNTCV